MVQADDVASRCTLSWLLTSVQMTCKVELSSLPVHVRVCHADLLLQDRNVLTKCDLL